MRHTPYPCVFSCCPTDAKKALHAVPSILVSRWLRGSKFDPCHVGQAACSFSVPAHSQAFPKVPSAAGPQAVTGGSSRQSDTLGDKAAG
jgi:hypothetical protein